VATLVASSLISDALQRARFYTPAQPKRSYFPIIFRLLIPEAVCGLIAPEHGLAAAAGAISPSSFRPSSCVPRCGWQRLHDVLTLARAVILSAVVIANRDRPQRSKSFPSFVLNHEKRPPSLLGELNEPIAQDRYPGGCEEE
jgi:hypothetical protein